MLGGGLLGLLVACDGGTSFTRPEIALTVAPASVTINQGGVVLLQADVRGASDGGVVWRTLHPDIATVSSDGVVRGVAPGTATIVVRASADSSRQALATITVLPPATIRVNQPAAVVRAGDTILLTVSTSHVLAPDIRWRSSHPDRATIGQDGRLLGVDSGRVTITAQLGQDSTVRDSLTLAIAPATAVVLPTSILTLKAGQWTTVAAEVRHNESASVGWQSSNPLVVAVATTGRIDAVGVGEATITATSIADPRRSAQLVVRVVRPEGPMVPVRLGADVSAATQAHIARLVSGADELAFSTDSALLEVPPQSAGTVFALNDRDEPLLAGRPSSTGSLLLDPHATALLLSEMTLAPFAREAWSQERLQASISNAVAFAELVDRVRRDAEQGTGFANPATVALAGAVASDAVASLVADTSAAPSSNTEWTRSRGARHAAQLETGGPPTFLTFTGLSLEYRRGSPGGALAFRSALWLPLQLRVFPGDVSRTIAARNLCAICANPFAGALPQEALVPLDIDGPVSIVANVDPATIANATRQIGRDFAKGFALLSGLSLSDRGRFQDAFDRSVNLEEVSSARTLGEGLETMIFGALTRAVTLLENSLSQSGRQLLRAAILPARVIDLVAWTVDRVGYYRDLDRYWSTPPETVTGCVEGAGFYRECLSQVRLGADSLLVFVGSTREYPVTYWGATGQQVEARSLTWLVQDGPPINVTSTVSSLAITPLQEGRTTLAAAVGPRVVSTIAVVAVDTSSRVEVRANGNSTIYRSPSVSRGTVSYNDRGSNESHPAVIIRAGPVNLYFRIASLAGDVGTGDANDSQFAAFLDPYRVSIYGSTQATITRSDSLRLEGRYSFRAATPDGTQTVSGSFNVEKRYLTSAPIRPLHAGQRGPAASLGDTVLYRRVLPPG